MKKLFYITNFILLISCYTCFVGCKSGHKEDAHTVSVAQIVDTTTSLHDSTLASDTIRTNEAGTTAAYTTQATTLAEKHTTPASSVLAVNPKELPKNSMAHWSSPSAQAKYDPNAKLVNQNTPIETPSINSAMLSAIQFEEVIYNYGTIKAGDKINHTFRFKNTGNVPLEIENAEGSCGCTQPVYPFIPINPGQTGEIKVAFNSLGKAGKVQTKVTITANTPQKTHYVFLEGDVVAKETANTKTDSTKVKS